METLVETWMITWYAVLRAGECLWLRGCRRRATSIRRRNMTTGLATIPMPVASAMVRVPSMSAVVPTFRKVTVIAMAMSSMNVGSAEAQVFLQVTAIAMAMSSMNAGCAAERVSRKEIVTVLAINSMPVAFAGARGRMSMAMVSAMTSICARIPLHSIMQKKGMSSVFTRAVQSQRRTIMTRMRSVAYPMVVALDAASGTGVRMAHSETVRRPACNYDPVATDDDGTCEYVTCEGCTDAICVQL